MDYSKYPPNWKTEIRPFILKRDKYRCSVCNRLMYHLYYDFDKNKYIRIVLQIAHLDHDAENWNVKMDRLAAMCGECHLRYDSNISFKRSKGKKKKKKKIELKELTIDEYLSLSKAKDLSEYWISVINK